VNVDLLRLRNFFEYCTNGTLTLFALTLSYICTLLIAFNMSMSL